MRIAVDAMGGDFAPVEIVNGAVQAARETSFGIKRLLLVGNETALKAELDKLGPVPSNLEIVHASEVVEMHESPVSALRKKKDSSISRSVDLVKAGEADAVYSAGSTGAAVAAAQLKLRTLSGIDRPGIAAVMPTPQTPFVLLDAGATIDCTARIICQFALMGEVYTREILGVKNPRIGLLSIGEEDSKGNDTSKEAFKILKALPGLNFVGNVESKDVFKSKVDVVACDGFVGNVVLKTSEAVASAMSKWLKASLTASLRRKLCALLLKDAFLEIKHKTDPETYGGAPLLGVNGTVIIGHGSSSARAVRNGIGNAATAVHQHINEHMIEAMKRLPESV